MSDAAPAGETEVAEGYAVLAQCWRQPTERLLAAIESGKLAGVVSESTTTDLSTLRTEHTRLFVGPEGPPCPPYESSYRDGGDDAGNVLGPSTRAVVEWYDEYGLGLDPEWSDLPDHVATEIEFAGHLSVVASSETRERFLDDHPRQWFETFFETVRAETREPFYVEIADATAAVVL
ncbi:TorD/DmsD family molecular chaperone [Halorhabdus rudnickae]|uniref:TorD/DmsD family molecular chaperone n=1 Tax=Halorhabdus rudnickae TaxID=1775544 RepID=UPI001083D5AA|nr:molecular chaperone TorD family protein [Halorhabdus rudnickae]